MAQHGQSFMRCPLVLSVAAFINRILFDFRLDRILLEYSSLYQGWDLYDTDGDMQALDLIEAAQHAVKRLQKRVKRLLLYSFFIHSLYASAITYTLPSSTLTG